MEDGIDEDVMLLISTVKLMDGDFAHKFNKITILSGNMAIVTWQFMTYHLSVPYYMSKSATIYAKMNIHWFISSINSYV